MFNLLYKMRAIPNYIKLTFQEQKAKYRKSHQLRILPLRELARPTLIRHIAYPDDSADSRCVDRVGVYLLDQIFIHRATGLCLLRSNERDWPIGIMESGLEPYVDFSLRHKQFSNAATIIRSGHSILDFSEPCFVFNVFLRKTNYFHFVKDNLSRLLTFLNSVDEEVIILHFFEREGVIGNYFDLLESIYQCRFEKISLEGSKHIKVTSPVYFIEDTFKRFTNSPYHAKNNFRQLETDEQLKMLGISVDDLSAVTHDDQIISRAWRHKPTGKIYKNNIDYFIHSSTSISAIYEFGLKVLERRNITAFGNNLIYIVRDKASSRKRFICNQKQIIDLPGITAVDFSTRSLEQQISIAHNCDVLIGLHGAGLVNAVYMKSGTSVIEFVPVGHSLPKSDLFENICLTRKISYHRIYSTPLTLDGFTTVNINDLEDVLESID